MKRRLPLGRFSPAWDDGVTLERSRAVVLRSTLLLAAVLVVSCGRPTTPEAPPQPTAAMRSAASTLRTPRGPQVEAPWRRSDAPPALPSELVDAEGAAATDVLLEEETPTHRYVLRIPGGGSIFDTPGSLELLVTIHASGTVVSVTLPSVSAQARSGGDAWIQVADFDFDGEDDFAIHDGDGGPYGSPTYAIFLQRPRTGTFEPSPELDALSASSLGGIVVDAQNKRLIVSSKSGCCIHWTEEYRMKNGAPELMRSDLVDGLSHPDGCVHTMRERNARGRMVEKTEPCDIE